MSYAEELRRSRDKAQVAYQEFALHTRKGKDGLFCFFEGKDLAYYVPRIKRFTEKHHPIRCGGRDRVLDVHRLISSHSEYNKYKKAFFVDRDFNEPLQPRNPPIFETPCYSIENLYTSIDVFKEILINELYLSEVEDAFETCKRLFIDRQNEFHNAVLLFNAWYACLIDIRNATGIQTGVKLENKLPKDFIEFSLQLISSKYDLEKIKQLFPNAIILSEEVLAAKLNAFRNSQYNYTFRGKYEIQFVVKMIELIIHDSIQTKLFFKEKINFAFSTSMSNEQAINVFSTYAKTPSSLEEYLKQVLSN